MIDGVELSALGLARERGGAPPSGHPARRAGESCDVVGAEARVSGSLGAHALRYQGEQAASAELELRWQYHPRFSLVGFGGVGAAWTELERFDDDQRAYAGGLGLRYLVSRKFGLHAGLDVAQGPEEGAIYVQFGSAWVRP